MRRDQGVTENIRREVIVLRIQSPRTPVSVGEEYVVSIEQMGRDGVWSIIQIPEIRLWLELRRWERTGYSCS